ncbi:MAG: PKD domain-containing protein [Flavobacteriales bacterium]|nr:PKD domain-containing protein [Flavobacteriales bacterium]
MNKYFSTMYKIKLFIILLLVAAFTTTAQNAGDNDPTFNSADINITLQGANNTVYATAIQSDGKIIIGGLFTAVNGVSMNRIARLNIDGTLDGTFNIGAGLDSTVRTISIQPDGKIVVGGEFIIYNGVPTNRLVRLNSDGSIDLTFAIGSGADNEIKATALQPDGKIIVGGSFTFFNGLNTSSIARLNMDGTLDTSFTTRITPAGVVWSISLHTDGKIVVGGGYSGKVGRINTNGSLDTTFNVGSGANISVNTTTIQPDGKIIIGGGFLSFNGTPIKRIARLNIDGTLDTSFVVGVGVGGQVYTSTIQSDGKIIIGGTFSSYNITSTSNIARLNTDGTLDTAFSIRGRAGTKVWCIAIQTNEQIIIGGQFTYYDGIDINRVARINTDGTLDGTFIIGTGFESFINTTKMQPDGKIIVGGWFSFYNHYSSKGIARLNIDGSLDTTFNIGYGIPNGEVVVTTTQVDGKIIVGGGFIDFNGTTCDNILRLNFDGTIDTTFITNSLTGFRFVATTNLQPDGKIIVGGNAINNRILRLNTDGSLDSTFLVGTGTDSTVRASVIQPDGKIIIAGSFNSYNGTSSNRIARLNNDGTFDGTFLVGSGANGDIYTIALQPDGKIIIGGNFTTYNGTSCNRVTRINDDGSIDNTFNIGTGANNQVWTTTLLSDGKILIGGMFTSYNGISRNNVAILNSDGTLDNTFDLGSGANSYVLSSAVDMDGKIIIAGDFTSYKGVVRNRIARILNCGATANYTSTDNSNGNYTFTNTSTGSFNQTHWAFGDGTTSTAANPNHTFSANGTYVVVLTVNDSTNGSCTDYYLDTIVVTGVVAPLQCAAGFVMYLDAGGVTVVNSSTGSNLTYLWDFGDGNTSNAQFPTHTYATTGNYYLCLTVDDGAGCVDMYCDSIGQNGVVFNKQTGFTINVIAPPLATQVNEQTSIINGLTIYPNPSSGIFIIEHSKENIPFIITDISGRVINTGKLTSNKTNIDLSKVQKGVYLLKIGEQTTKLIRQ